MYVGRFAPSPTGPLHFGSLTTAVASYLHARQSRGAWLVRIEDIDPPREVPGASDDILRTLEAFSLRGDGPVVYQSSRRAVYDEIADDLLARGEAFLCSCTRAEVRADASGAVRPYPGTCRTATRHERATAVRMKVDGSSDTFVDGVQGTIEARLADTTGAYIVRRRDGLPAYHLAVVVDDAAQGVTSVVRGVDLLDSTAVHRHLQRVLGLPTPAYFHVPVIVGPDGEKLSKQTGAAPVSASAAANLARRVLATLGAAPPPELQGAPPAEAWSWAEAHWDIGALRHRRSLPDPGMGSALEQD